MAILASVESLFDITKKKYASKSLLANYYDSFSDDNDVIIHLNCGREVMKANKPNLSKISPFFRRILKFTNELHFVDLDSKMINLVYEYVQDKTGVNIPSELKQKFCKVLRIFEIDDLEIQNSTQLQVANINFLPPELLLHILSFVSTEDLLVNVSRVSKMFYELVQDPNLHHTVSLHSGVDIFSAAIFVRKLPLMRKLQLTQARIAKHSHRDCHFLIETVIKNCPKVREIEMTVSRWSWDISKDCFRMLANSELMPKLTYLKLSTTRNFDQEDCALLAKGKSLRCIDLNGNSYIKNVDKIVESCTKLEDLKVNLGNIDHSGLSALINSRHKTLKSLEFRLAENSIEILQILPNCQKLENLSIKKGLTKYIGFRHIAQLTNLKSLTVETTYMNPKNFSKNFTHQSFNQLESLQIASHALEDTCLIAIGDACPNLKTLSIREKSMYSLASDAGLEYIAKHCSKLEKLTLIGTERITTTFIENISTNLPCLNVLTVNNCQNINNEDLVKAVQRSRRSLMTYKDNVLITKLEVGFPIVVDIFAKSFPKDIWFCIDEI